MASTGGVHSPLTVALAGTGTDVGAAPILTKTTPSLAFGSVRLRTQSPEQVVTITNSGTAPLGITNVQLDPATSEGSNYVILADTCSTGTTVPAGGTCTLRVLFVPLTAGPHPTQILLDSNAASSPDSIPVTGTGTGGVAAVGPTNPDNGFPEWYRDENGVSIQACLDPNDAELHPGGGRVLRPGAAGGLPDQLPERVLLPARDVGQRHDAGLQRRPRRAGAAADRRRGRVPQRRARSRVSR